MKTKMKGFFGILLSLSIIFGLMPMSLTAYAGTSYGSYLVTSSDTSDTLSDKTVHFNSLDWYIISDDSTAVDNGTVTLFSKDCIGVSQFRSDQTSSKYSDSVVNSYLDNMTNDMFSSVKDAIQTVTVQGASSTDVVDAKLWLLSSDEATALSTDTRICDQASGAEANRWWLRSKGNTTGRVKYVKGDTGAAPAASGAVTTKTYGVRPALKLDLSEISFDEATKTFGASEQVSVTGLTLDPSSAVISASQTVKLTAIVSPDDATDNKVKWSVGGTNSDAVKLYYDKDCTTQVKTDADLVHTVYAKGMVAGSATVTCTSNADNTIYATCDITVNRYVTVDGITLDKSKVTLPVDTVKSLTATFVPENATVQTVRWSAEGYGVNPGEVKLYSDSECTTEIGTGSTDVLTVYAKGESKGNVYITVTSCNDDYYNAACNVKVGGYSVTVNPGSNMTKTDSSGSENQTDLEGAMNDVVYTADDGYYFPEDYSVDSVNGISVTRNSGKQITVSGTPTDDAKIALTSPTADPLDEGYSETITAGDAASMDGNKFNLPSDLVYKKASLLGVQKKEDIQTSSDGQGLRFIGEISSEYLSLASDYGFEIVKTKKQNTKDFNDSDGFAKMQTLIDSGSGNIKTVSCYGTTNSVANPEYGDDDLSSTPYKYVTMAINNVPDDQGIAVRFYVTIDGTRYYSSYTNADGTFKVCCTSYNTLRSLETAAKDEE